MELLEWWYNQIILSTSCSWSGKQYSQGERIIIYIIQWNLFSFRLVVLHSPPYITHVSLTVCQTIVLRDWLSSIKSDSVSSFPETIHIYTRKYFFSDLYVYFIFRILFSDAWFRLHFCNLMVRFGPMRSNVQKFGLIRTDYITPACNKKCFCLSKRMMLDFYFL